MASELIVKKWFDMEAEQLERVAEIAKQENRSVAAQIRQLLQEALERRKTLEQENKAVGM